MSRQREAEVRKRTRVLLARDLLRSLEQLHWGLDEGEYLLLFALHGSDERIKGTLSGQSDGAPSKPVAWRRSSSNRQRRQR